jgi:hypothetical protein
MGILPLLIFLFFFSLFYINNNHFLWHNNPTLQAVDAKINHLMHFSPIVAVPSAAPHTFCLDITIFKS